MRRIVAPTAAAIAGAALALVGLSTAGTAAATPARPTVTSLNRVGVASTGGSTLTVHGTNFRGVTAVTFGAAHGTGVKVKSAKVLTVSVPAHVIGSVDVRVTARGGRSATSVHDRLAYLTTNAIDAGSEMTCSSAIKSLPFCFGNGEHGQTGNGVVSATAQKNALVRIPGVPPIAEMSLGSAFACALAFNGTVWCWGDNEGGELGNGLSATDSPTPTVVHLPPAVAIAAGYDSACAVLRDRTLRCWGRNDAGELGRGDYTDATTPVTPTGHLHVTALAAGSETTCAIDTTRHAWCWGQNHFGEVGDGTTQNRYGPVRVSDLGTVTDIESSAMSDSMCALTVAERVECWGYNVHGQLGNGSTADADTPQPVPGLTGVSALAVGGGHACAVSGRFKLPSCWGDNTHGQLGLDRVGGPDVLSPTSLDDVAGVTDISAGYNHTCAVSRQQDVPVPAEYCWGGDAYGQLGDDGTTDNGTPFDFSGRVPG